MVSPEYLIGVFDNQKKLRSGTAQTVNYALHQGKVITLIHPDTMGAGHGEQGLGAPHKACHGTHGHQRVLIGHDQRLVISIVSGWIRVITFP